MQKVLGIISIILGIFFLSKVFRKRKQDQKNRREVMDLINSGKQKELDKFFGAGYALTNTGILSEGFGFLFIIYGLNLLFGS